MNINQVTIVGRLTRDPELKSLPSGMKIVNASIATSRTHKNKAGEKTEEVEFHNIVAFDKTAEIMGQYLKKGQLVGITGRLKTSSWDGEDGKKRYRTEIMVEQMQMGPKAGEKTEGGYTAPEPRDDVSQAKQEIEAGSEINPDDIPF